MTLLTGFMWSVLVLRGVVDQLYPAEGAALVEWEERHDGWVPVALLPAGVEEGDEVELRIRTKRRWRPRAALSDVTWEGGAP